MDGDLVRTIVRGEIEKLHAELMEELDDLEERITALENQETPSQSDIDDLRNDIERLEESIADAC